MGQVARWIDAQDDEVLGRLARAKKWIAGKLTDRDGGACLLGHAHADMDADTFMLAVHYDALCLRFGDARIGRLISERARRALEERRLEAWRKRPKGVSEQEASVYFRTHVSLICEPVEVGA